MTTAVPITSRPTLTDTPAADRGLQAWTLAMVAFGLATAAITWVRNDLFSWIATGDSDAFDGASPDVRDYIAFNQALLGAVTAALGLAAFWLARVPVARRERWGSAALVTTLGLWFVVDNAASLATGYPRNVVFNLALTAPALPLLWLTRPAAARSAPAASPTSSTPSAALAEIDAQQS